MRPILFYLVPLLASLFLFARCAPAAEDETDAAVQDARDSLGSRGTFPWYDRQADAPRPLRLKTVEDDSENRTSNWQPGAPRMTRMPNISWLGSILYVMGLTALVALLVLAVVFITRAFLSGEVTETAGSKVVETGQDVDRVERRTERRAGQGKRHSSPQPAR